MSVLRRKVWVVVLAGGDGRRLGDLTTDAAGISTPKQYCSLGCGPSLLQLALQRALGLAPRNRIVPMVTEAHRTWWACALRSFHASRVVVQPSNHGTGLGVLLPLLVIAKTDPDAAVICIPSDHYVEQEDILAEYLRQATAPQALDSDKVTLLVQRFFEKPDSKSAAESIRGGGVWSAGIVAGKVSQMVGLYPRDMLGLISVLKDIVESWPNPRLPCPELASVYAHQPILDFSTDVLAKHPEKLQFITVPPCGWSDVGMPDLASTVPLRPAARSFNLATAFDRQSQKATLETEARRIIVCTAPKRVDGTYQ